MSKNVRRSSSTVAKRPPRRPLTPSEPLSPPSSDVARFHAEVEARLDDLRRVLRRNRDHVAGTVAAGLRSNGVLGEEDFDYDGRGGMDLLSVRNYSDDDYYY